MSELSRHTKSDKIKWWIVTVVIILVTAALIAVCVKVFGDDTVKTLNSTHYEIGRLSDDDGKTLIEGDETGIYTKDFLTVNGLKVKLVENAEIAYQINFYDENYNLLETDGVKDMTTSLTDADIPATAKYCRIEIVPTADKDGKVGIFEIKKYSDMLVVTVEKDTTN